MDIGSKRPATAEMNSKVSVIAIVGENLIEVSAVVPSNGSACVPLPGSPSVRTAIQISCCGIAVGVAVGVGEGVDVAIGVGLGVAAGGGVGVGFTGIKVTEDLLGVDSL
jgi:hypothetical protein